jgi:hypothetical protein
MKYFIYHLVSLLALNSNQLILPPAEVRKVCYSLAELYIKSVYLNVLGRGVHEVHETLNWGAQAITFWEPLL